MNDFVMIILSAFSVIGIFYVLELISGYAIKKDIPQSVTFMKYSESDMTYLKYKSLCFNIYKNKIVFIGEDNKNIYPDTEKISLQELESFIINNLFTNLYN